MTPGDQLIVRNDRLPFRSKKWHLFFREKFLDPLRRDREQVFDRDERLDPRVPLTVKKLLSFIVFFRMADAAC